MMRRFARALALALAGFAPGLVAQESMEPPNGVLLVAREGLTDPRFRETVILVTQTRDFQTVGVILNKPLGTPLADYSPSRHAGNYKDRVYLGGPVMPRTLVALFRSDEAPAGPAFHVLKGIFLSMQPAVTETLLASAGGRYRLFAGFSGWMPRQLEAEMRKDSWYMLPASEDLLFSDDPSRMWSGLVATARGQRAGHRIGDPIALY
jgi:putative transcriptional regulator